MSTNPNLGTVSGTELSGSRTSSNASTADVHRSGLYACMASFIGVLVSSSTRHRLGEVGCIAGERLPGQTPPRVCGCWNPSAPVPPCAGETAGQVRALKAYLLTGLMTYRAQARGQRPQALHRFVLLPFGWLSRGMRPGGLAVCAWAPSCLDCISGPPHTYKPKFPRFNH